MGSVRGTWWVLTTTNQDSECSTQLIAFTTVLYPTLRRRAIVAVFELSCIGCSAVAVIS